MKAMWTDFQKPKWVEVDRSTLTDTYGRFVAEPFERGFGITIGNALRRVLLASIRGAAITAIALFALGGPLAAAAQNLSIAAFSGKWIGSAISESAVSVTFPVTVRGPRRVCPRSRRHTRLIGPAAPASQSL